MKKWIGSVLFLGLMTSGYAQCEQLVWSDEFDSPSIDLDNWSFEIGDGCPGLCGWGNAELQYYTDSQENAFIEDGKLIIQGQYNPGDQFEYTSARLITEGKQTFASGRIEARIKMPQGQGMWPAFWMLPEERKYGNWPLSGEIDITEMVGFDPATTHGTVHYGPMWPNNQFTGESASLSFGILADDFHTYAVEWSDEEIRWFIDGSLFSVRTISNLGDFPWRYDQEYFIILNLAIGGYWPGYPDNSTSFPQRMEVDYVRVYQKADDTFIVGPDFVAAEAQGIEYTVPTFEGASYNWTATNGEVTSGQGSEAVTVDWQEGESQEVTVAISYDGCTQNVTRDVQVGGVCQTVFANFEDVREAQWTWFNGSYSELGVPFPDEVNSSFSCAKYTRGTDGQSALRMGIDGISNSLDFESGDKVLAMKVLTNAPVGTVLKIYLENHRMTGFPSLNGRRSSFTAQTSATQEWETLYFTFEQVIDMNVSELEVNHLTLQSTVAENIAYVFYLDDISSFESDCITIGLEEVGNKTSALNVVPNANGIGVMANETGTVSVFGITGQLIANQQINAFEQEEIQLPSGAYIVSWNNGVSNQKVIVQ